MFKIVILTLAGTFSGEKEIAVNCADISTMVSNKDGGSKIRSRFGKRPWDVQESMSEIIKKCEEK